LFAPAGTPDSIMKKIFESVKIALGDPKAKAAITREATEVILAKTFSN
jgi:tripartite-type tricarboxylate transporter receptor subunit TctC